MPITNRDKKANNTVVSGSVVPIVNQQATLTARGYYLNESPHDGRPMSSQGTNQYQTMVGTINRVSPVTGSVVNKNSDSGIVSSGVKVINAGVNVVGGVTSAAGVLGKGISNAVNMVDRGLNTARNIVGGTVNAISKGAATISGITNTVGGILSGKNSSSQSPITAVKQVSSNIPGIGGFSNPAAGLSSGLSSLGRGVLTSLQLQNNTQLIDILTSSGKKTQNNEIKYRIILTFEGQDKNPYDDVLVFVVERFGFLRSSTKYGVKINLPPVLVAQLKQNESQNKNTKVNVKIYQVDTENNNKLKTLVIERNFEVVVVKEEKSASIERSQTTTVFLMMVNPTLVQMDRQYTYNKIQNTKTAYEVLQDYEGYLTSTYGDNFVSKHILGQKNEFKYEQILTQPSDQEIKLPNRTEFKFLCKHDSDIPLFLNYKYKIDNAFSFYLFDDFDLKSEKEITRLFIALYDKNKFEKFKTDNQQDISLQTQLTGTYQFRDVNGLLTPGSSVNTNKLINCEFDTKKEQTSSNIQSNTQISGQVESAGGDPNRKYNAQKTTETQHQIPVKQGQSTSQVPDSAETAAARSEAAHKVFSEKIEQIDCFVTKNCGMDYLRFGVLYAMNNKKPNEQLHTPVAIVNIFRRDNDKETVLGHNAKTMMVKFSAESQSESSSQSKSSNSGQNANRDATKKAADANKNNSQQSQPKTSTELKEAGGSTKVGDMSGKSNINTPTNNMAPLSKETKIGSVAAGPVSNAPSTGSLFDKYSKNATVGASGSNSATSDDDDEELFLMM